MKHHELRIKDWKPENENGLCGLSIMKWCGLDKEIKVCGNYKMFYWGGNSVERGVTIVIQNNWWIVWLTCSVLMIIYYM